MIVLSSVLSSLGWAFTFAFCTKLFLVKGTRLRYLLHTVCLAMLVPWWADGLVTAYLVGVAGVSPVWSVLFLLFKVPITWLVLKSDEDSWWNGRGRKIGRWVARHFTAAGAAQGAGA